MECKTRQVVQHGLAMRDLRMDGSAAKTKLGICQVITAKDYTCYYNTFNPNHTHNSSVNK